MLEYLRDTLPPEALKKLEAEMEAEEAAAAAKKAADKESKQPVEAVKPLFAQRLSYG